MLLIANVPTHINSSLYTDIETVDVLFSEFFKKTHLYDADDFLAIEYYTPNSSFSIYIFYYYNGKYQVITENKLGIGRNNDYCKGSFHNVLEHILEDISTYF
jgi:hypothetical protein